MKRIDLHVHTLSSPLEDDYEFDLSALVDHVSHNRLDAIAITNHNQFNLSNYDEARSALSDATCVLPGIEVSVRGYHVLVIANPDNAATFAQVCSEVPSIEQGDDGISLKEFIRLFGDGSHIVIPHYKKRPLIPSSDLADLGDIVSALEVSSEKKWQYENGRVNKPVVRFSDYRCSVNTKSSWGKYTFVSMGDVSFDSLRLAFHDKTLFSVTERDDHFELEPGLYASMGLNVVIGGRSTGKTFLLDRIYNSCDPDDVVYVKQFGIIKDADEKVFREKLLEEESSIKREYYEPMNAVFSAIEQLPTREGIRGEIKDYLADLMEYAETSARDDEYSKCPLFSASKIPAQSTSAEEKVVEAILVLLDENPISSEIEKIVGYDVLVKLFGLALNRYREKALACKCVDKANEIVRLIKDCLTLESRRPACPESPMIEAAKRTQYIGRLAKLRGATKQKKVISSKQIGKFKRVTKRVSYKDATALKSAIGATSSLSGVLQLGDREYVERILEAQGVTDISRSLFDISVVLINERNEEVSGGQKAEYLFFQAIDKASNHDVVLIDEPESSFDNPFLNELIASELKKISRKATVFISTHNNVLGVSIKPNGIVYTDVSNGIHRVFSGDATDDILITSTGETIRRSEALLHLMEAGNSAYEDRRPYYGFAKN